MLGDQLYVTTAYVAPRGRVLDAGLRALTLALLVIVAWLALERIVARCQSGNPPSAPALIGSSGIAFVVLVLAVVACSDESLFDYARCTIRGWMASTVFVSLCRGLMAPVPSAGGRAWRSAWQGRSSPRSS